MKDHKKVVAIHREPPKPDPVTGCIVCGSYAGPLEPVAGAARAHAACADARPDVIAKVKARA
jgi:hypothetical protein